ncbi:MAG: excinuclease ABC subunit UvrC [Tidjanibacter sp.]|nr:excinuclease ABC subunit UvrC [Tidjanibacter sp.]
MEERVNADLMQSVRLLPVTPGVYQFFDASGKVIYVGKAVNLRRRVSSYFVDSKRHAAKVRVMVGKIVAMKHIDTATESDALLLENSLIKTLRPRYNILLKDDKTYPWIVVRNEPFPRVESTRRMVRDGSQYFGPYASVMSQKAMLEFVREIYQLRTCRLNLSPEAVAKGNYRVCLQYHLGNCKGPCEGRQSAEDYAATIEMLKGNLKGDTRPTKLFLEEQMRAAAESLNFEQAAYYKLRLDALADYSAKSVIVSDRLGNLDVFSLLVDEQDAYCNFVRVSNGTITASSTVTLSIGAESDPHTILSHAIRRIAEGFDGGLAREVIVPFRPDEVFEDVRLTVPSRGDKLKLLQFSEKGARMFRAERLKNLEIKSPERHTERLLAALQRELHLSVPPHHIECFDNSNLQGTHPVASCVVFRDGRPSRSEYRHFNIKTVVGADDFASMREIIGRRYRRLLDEGAQLPDLIIVDGGKGQLSSAYAVLCDMGLEGRIPIVGLAKRIEEIYFPRDPEPYYLDRTGEPLKVVMHLRDEAHRFGITFHRNKRSADFVHTELNDIDGVGAKSAENLLRRFGSVEGVRRASLTDLAAEIGQARATRVYGYFHK